MSIGIVGAGTLGSNIARLLAKNRISATIANNRGPSRWRTSSANSALRSQPAASTRPRAPISSW